MMRFQSTLNQTTIEEETGVLLFRCRKELVTDDGVAVDLGWHRFSVAPGDDANAVLSAVQAHLASDQIQGGPITGDGLDRVRKVVAREHTKERIDTYRAMLARHSDELRKRGGGPA